MPTTKTKAATKTAKAPASPAPASPAAPADVSPTSTSDASSTPADATDTAAEPVERPDVQRGQLVTYTYFDDYADADVVRIGLVFEVTDEEAATARVIWLPSDEAHAIPVGDLVPVE